MYFLFYVHISQNVVSQVHHPLHHPILRFHKYISSGDVVLVTKKLYVVNETPAMLLHSLSPEAWSLEPVQHKYRRARDAPRLCTCCCTSPTLCTTIKMTT